MRRVEAKGRITCDDGRGIENISERKDESLLQTRRPGLAQARPHTVDGRFALHLPRRGIDSDMVAVVMKQARRLPCRVKPGERHLEG